MTGFGSDSKKEKESTGLYSKFVGEYVRIHTKQGGSFLGLLCYTDPNQSRFQPYLLDLPSPLSVESKIVKDRYSQVDTETIAGMARIPEGLKYLERIVKEVEEQNKIQKFLREKDLKEKGYKTHSR